VRPKKNAPPAGNHLAAAEIRSEPPAQTDPGPAVEIKGEEKPNLEPPKPKDEPQPQAAAVKPAVKPAAKSGPSLDEAVMPLQAAAVTPELKLQPPAKRPAAGETKLSSTGTGTEKSGDPAAGDRKTADPVAKAQPGDLIALENVDVAPEIVRSVDPVYPTRAQRLNVQGSVTVNALIDESGDVVDAGILKGLKDDMGLERAAETAVRRWKFRPAEKDGVKVKVWKPIVIVFKTDGRPTEEGRRP
jgi:protein TonB